MKNYFNLGICLASILALTACAQKAAQPPGATLNVFAAASLTGAFGEIGKAFEAAHPGVSITFNFAGSQALAAQINNAAPCDVFASANDTQMGVVTQAGRIDKNAPKTFVKNRLVVIYPKANPATLGEKIWRYDAWTALSRPTTPCSRRTRATRPLSGK